MLGIYRIISNYSYLIHLILSMFQNLNNLNKKSNQIIEKLG